VAKPSKVEVDQETCIGCGVCADMVPDVFEMQDGKSIVINAQGVLPCRINHSRRIINNSVGKAASRKPLS